MIGLGYSSTRHTVPNNRVGLDAVKHRGRILSFGQMRTNRSIDTALSGAGTDIGSTRPTQKKEIYPIPATPPLSPHRL
jgi:hypothetical protein